MTSVSCIHPSRTARSRSPRIARYGAASAATALAVSATLLASVGSASAAASPVLLGTAEPFAVLAGMGITNTGSTVIGGDIGSLPTDTLAVTGSIVITGTNHAGDGVTALAKTDVRTAYDNAALQPMDLGNDITADLAGQTLTPGVWESATDLAIQGPLPLTLDANNDPNAIFLLKSPSTLITSPNTTVLLVDGATACNVFWQVSSSTTLGVNSTFRGIILTEADTTLNTGATLEGSALSVDGAVTMDAATIIRPACATAPTGGKFRITASGTTPITTPGTPSGPGNGVDGQVARIPVGAVAAGGGGSSAVGRLWPSTR